jgi:hypothetical protein
MGGLYRPPILFKSTSHLKNTYDIRHCEPHSGEAISYKICYSRTINGIAHLPRVQVPGSSG